MPSVESTWDKSIIYSFRCLNPESLVFYVKRVRFSNKR